MKLGLIGLGKMGFPLAEHLHEDGHDVVVYDVNQELVEKAGQLGIVRSSYIKETSGNAGITSHHLGNGTGWRNCRFSIT